MSDARPTQYASEKLPTLLKRWHGPAGEYVRRYSADVWPGVPPSALLGLTASSEGPTEVIGILSSSGSAVGLFGVEGNQVAALCASRNCTQLLGREPDASIHGNGYIFDLEAQVVTGLLNYRRHLEIVAARHAGGPSISALAEHFDVWELACAAAGYSAGPGITSNTLARYHAALDGVPPAARWKHLGLAVDGEHEPSFRDQRTGRTFTLEGRYGVAFLVVRAAQRIACGRALEEALGGEALAWFGEALDDRVAESLARKAYGSLDTRRRR